MKQQKAAGFGPPLQLVKKSPWDFLTASAAEHFDFIKMLLRPKSLFFRLFCGGLLDHENTAMPLPEAEEGIAVFPQPHHLAER